MNTVFLSLGSNEGDRQQWLHSAIGHLGAYGRIVRSSSIYETAAWGLQDQPDFLNMAVRMETALAPAALLQAIQHIENLLGRVRTVKWGPRTLDIDMLFFNDDIIDTPSLTIPHPFLAERRFVLMPLAEIAPHFVHPVSGKTIAALLAACTDTQDVKRLPA